ncbi:MAG: hypothetical protein ACE5JS_19380 [Nitrospinota bacterium]
MSISNVPEITERVCVPRAAFIQYPFGRPLGDVGERRGQRRVCDDLADALISAEGPNSYRHLPYEWPEPPSETKWRADEPPPLGRYAQEKGVNLADTLLRAMRDDKREL